jgi:hypothetical protein
MVIWKVIDAARQSGWVKAAAALCVLAICIGSLLPETERLTTGLPSGKLEHFLAYGVTGLLLGLAMSGRKAPILAALFSLARLPPGVLAAMEHGAPPAGERCGGRRARRHAGRRLVGMVAQRCRSAPGFFSCPSPIEFAAPQGN